MTNRFHVEGRSGIPFIPAVPCLILTRGRPEAKAGPLDCPWLFDLQAQAAKAVQLLTDAGIPFRLVDSELVNDADELRHWIKQEPEAWVLAEGQEAEPGRCGCGYAEGGKCSHWVPEPAEEGDTP